MRNSAVARKTRRPRTGDVQSAPARRGGIAIAPPNYGIEVVDGASREANPVQRKGPSSGADQQNNTGLPPALKTGIESLSGLSMEGVKVHYNSPKPARLQALAYARSTDIHVGPGREAHLPHEAWHVVQQAQGRVKATTRVRGVPINDDASLEREADVMGRRAVARGSDSRATRPAPASHGPSNVVQGYFDQRYLTSTWRQADDLTMAVKPSYPNHEFYATAGKVADANTKLAAVDSGVELVEKSTTSTFTKGYWWPSARASLKKVEAKNKKNKTQGDNMLLYADCGKSNAAVVGGSDRQAVYDAPGGAAGTKAPGSPTEMKSAIMKAWLTHKESTEVDVARKALFTSALDDAWLEEGELGLIRAELAGAATEAEEDAIWDRYDAKLEDIADTYWEHYNSLPAATRDQIDAALKINRHAKPDVGQGYTTSSGGPSAGKATWNFHWGGVVMVSNDGADRVVLENYATGDPAEENKKWTFDMYGTAKAGQTFHERHKATQQHGTTPTTMTIEKEP